MSNKELIHSVEFADHLAGKWAKKMFYPARSSVQLLLGQWLGLGIQNSGTIDNGGKENSCQPKVLELGYGTGDFAKVVEELSLYKGIDYRGVDISESFKEVASRRLPSLNFTLGEGAHLDYPDGHFDFSFTVDVLRHNKSWIEILRELSRVTRREVFVADIFEIKPPIDGNFVERPNEFHTGHSYAWSIKYFANEAQKYFNHVSVVPIVGYNNKILILSNEDVQVMHVFQTPVHIPLSSAPVHQPILFGRSSKVFVFAKASLHAVRNILRSAFN